MAFATLYFEVRSLDFPLTEAEKFHAMSLPSVSTVKSLHLLLARQEAWLGIASIAWMQRVPRIWPNSHREFPALVLEIQVRRGCHFATAPVS